MRNGGALSGGTNYKAASSPSGRALKGVPSAIYRAHGHFIGASRGIPSFSTGIGTFVVHGLTLCILFIIGDYIIL